MTNVMHSNIESGSPASADEASVLLQVTKLSKAFGATKAIREATLTLRSGEVHAILGENGSGKSTLVKILAGVQVPDNGTIKISEELKTDSVRSPAHTSIATVFQEVLVASDRSVLDNVWLGTDRVLRSRVGAAEKRAKARSILDQLTSRPLPLDAAAASLSLNDQQACCIARALVREPKVLILDEATSALDLETRDRLFVIIERLRSEGMGTIFISHRMDELLRLADRTTIMRSGTTIATVKRAEATSDYLVGLMTDQKVEEQSTGRSKAREDPLESPVVLRAKGLRLSPLSKPIDLEIKAGEILGIAGLEGHGQESLLSALLANESVSRVLRDGKTVTLRSPGHAASQGIVYVPKDRRKASIFASRSILENFSVATLDADSKLGFFSEKSSRARFDEYAASLSIKFGKADDAITTLSGGNQQKVVLARWLAAAPDVLLLCDPTRGVDLGAKRDIYKLLRGVAAAGTAIVMLSSELEEHLQLMDRVIVMREGSLFTTFQSGDLTRERLISAFFGRTEQEKP